MSGILLYLGIARRHKWVVGGTCLGAAVLAAVISLVLKPMYEAKARVLVLEPMIESKRSPYSNVTSFVYTVDTYTSMVESQQLLAEAIRSLRLDLPPDNLTPRSLGRMLSVIPVTDTKLIQISLRYQNPVTAKLLVNEVAAQFISMYQALKEQEIAASQHFVREQVEQAKAQFERSQWDYETARSEAQVEEMEGRIRAQSEEVKEYEILLTDVESRLAGERAKLADLAEQLDSVPSMVLASTTEGASTVLDSKSPLSDAELTAETAALLTSIEQAWPQSPPQEDLQEARAVVEELRDVMEQRKRLRTKAGARADRQTLVTGLEKLRDLLKDLRPAGNPVAGEAADLLARATGTVRVEGTHAVERRNPLRDRLEADIATCRAEIASLEAQRRKLGAALAETDRDFQSVQQQLYEGERKIAIAEMEAKSLTETNLMLTQKLDESRLEVAARMENLLLIDPATVPDRKVWPRRKVNVAVGAFLGLMVGYAVALILEARSGSEQQQEPLRERAAESSE
jgi:capsular polysaccharide biosynthesis protein